jgi:CRP-like cAMP-binding protein
MEFLKKELSTGIDGLQHLMQVTQNNNSFQAFTDGRNTNKYKKKQLIYTEGNHPNRLYYVLKGKVKVYRSNDDGKELVTEIATPGDFIGYISLLEDTIYKDNAQAMEETELAIIPKEDFDELMNNNKEISKQFIKLLARNISAKEKQLLSIAYNSLRKKVADALIMLQKKLNEKNEPGFAIDLGRENMANVAGTAKESLIRTLGDFRDEKLIDITQEGSIIILNQKKLEQLLN